jgi:polyhydroxyalkanoate synthesis regulator protein
MPIPAALKLKTILVKRYARSRLYDTTNGRYVSVEQLRDWAVDHVDFAVIDSQTDMNITHVLLPAGLKIC